MRAAWYESRGPAAEVLSVGEMPDPHPGPGEVRIRVARSGINPGDVKKRAPWLGYSKPAYPRIIPHSDGAGVIDEVGAGVQLAVGTRVWCFGAQSYRAFGTAAEYVVVPEALAVALPESASFAAGACLGIPGITAHRLVFHGDPVRGRRVLVQGGAGAVGALAVRLAAAGGAEVIATVRDEAQVAEVRAAGASRVLTARGDALVEAVLAVTDGDGVDRIVEVAFAANVEVDTKMLAIGGTLAAYATDAEEPRLPFWPLLFKDATIYLCGSDDVPLPAKREAAMALNALLENGWDGPPVGAELPLDAIVSAHEAVDRGARTRVLLAVRGRATPIDA